MMIWSVRSNAVLCLTLFLGAREGRERALATGMDAVLQDLRSRKAGHDDHVFTKGIEVRWKASTMYVYSCVYMCVCEL